MAWREELHPRDTRGRFTHKGAAAAVSIKATLSNLSDASSDELADVFHRLSEKKKLDEKSLRKIDEELARREGLDELPAPDPDRAGQRIDELVSRGWSYADAYAEVYRERGPGRGAAQEEYALLRPRQGETTEQARRRAYREVVALQALQAEEATRGNLLAHPCRNVDPASLWSAPPARARRCASEELKRWWESHGGRTNYATFRAQLVGGSEARGRAQAGALAGAGRDFGV